MAKQKIANRKNPNKGPARDRYWGNKVLQRKKVRRVMHNYGMTYAEAFRYWHDARQGRRMRGVGTR